MSDITGPLPGDGKERQIFLAALRTYRDQCQPPELSPDCPFFTWTANGPACGEQCADLLAIYGDEEDSAQQIDLGGGIKFVRQPPMRRPRRGPGAGDRPFDARQIFLSDANRPHADRRTVALIAELIELVSQPPSQWTDPGERSYDIQAVREQLDLRGLDVEGLIRYGIGASLPVSVTAYILLPLMMEDANLRPMLEAVSSTKVEVDGHWQKYFQDAFRTDTGITDPGRRLEQLEYALHGFLDRIREWLDNAPLDDILMWRVPDLNVSAAPVEPAEPERTQRSNKSLWAIERFTKHDFDEWSLTSLHLEWLYLHGRLPGPCSPTAMAERPVSSADVNAAIARETSETWLRHSSTKDADSSAGDFINVASRHLRNDKPELAAAIFEALAHVNPDDAEALNNYGFCLIAIDPTAALKSLNRANQLYEGTYLTTIANRILALHLTGRNDEAYALGISEAARTAPSFRSLMWLVGDNHDLELSDWIDTRDYLKMLMEHINTCDTKGSPVQVLLEDDC